jgi:predicted RNase H-like HicB family nuclease
MGMSFAIELEQEADGRWIAEVPDLPGVLAYGATQATAIAAAEALALRVLADRVELGEAEAPLSISFVPAAA